jgi:Growth inhibitor
VSPDELNHHVGTVIIAPMTTKGKSYPTRVTVKFMKKEGQIVLDQLRTVDKSRLVKKLGKITASDTEKVLKILQQMFAK